MLYFFMVNNVDYFMGSYTYKITLFYWPIL